MVRVAIAGASGELAREIIDVLAATKKHEIVLLSRNQMGDEEITSGGAWKTVDYSSITVLVEALRGVHTVLSFVNQHVVVDENDNSQKNLIDACIVAGVKRFSPSEYGCHIKEDLPFWAGKIEIEEYLKRVNENGKVLEYTLFYPGLFMDYLASPHKTTKYITPLDTFIDFQNTRAIVIEGYEGAIMTFTSVEDIAGVVARAVELETEWPRIGGIKGSRNTVKHLIEMGERIRGRPFTIETVRLEDLEAGILNTTWTLGREHPSSTDLQAEQIAAIIKSVLIGTLLTCVKGGWDVGDGISGLLPDYEFVDIENFLKSVWDGQD